MKIPVLLLGLSTFALAQPEGDDLLPARWFENIPATDDSIQRTLVFKSTAGVLYTVETSNNLTDWNTEETFYGLGHDVLVPMYEYTPPPPPPPGTPPAELPPRPLFASLTLRREASPGTGTIVSWRSLEGGAPIITRIDTALHPDWENQILHTHQANGYHLFIFGHYQAAVATPAPLPTLTTADQALLDHLAAQLPAINIQVENATAIARAAPPPAPQSGQKQFWRIKADWSLDSDGDGTPDWLEYKLIALGPDSNGAYYDAHNGDTNQDSTPDGAQRDADKDGIPDDMDPGPGDRLISTNKGPLWRYAVFRLPARPAEDYSHHPPQMVNAEGKVLYPDAVWHNGSLHQLEQENEGHISYAHAFSINDGGKIMGWGMPERLPTGAEPDPDPSGGLGTFDPVCAWWDSHTTLPVPVEANGKFAFPVSMVIPSNPGDMPYPFDSLLSADHAFLADYKYTGNAKTRVIVRKSTTGGFEIIPDNRLETEGYDARFMKSISPTESGLSSFWGEWQTGTRLCKPLTQFDFSQFQITRYQRMPSSNPARRFEIIFGNGGASQIYCRLPHQDNDEEENQNAPYQWQVLWSSNNPTIDLSDNGVRLVSPSTLFQDIRSGPFIEWAPDVSAAEVAPEWINASDNGWQLGHWPATGQANLSMPVLFEDSVEYTGVDSFSLSGTSKFNSDPDETDGTQEKSWIMVPKGGDPNEFKLHSLAGDGNTLTVEAPGLLFGNATDATEVTTPVATLSLSASPESETIASGAEINLNLRLGTGADSISMPLAAKVMKRRTVRVGLFKVSGVNYQKFNSSNETWEHVSKAVYDATATENRRILQEDHVTTVPDEEDLEDYLNEVYAPQINVIFDVVPYAETIERAFLANEDLDYLHIASPVGEGKAKNYVHSEEQMEIHGGGAVLAGENQPNIYVYLIARTFDVGGYGLTIRGERTCWIDSSHMMATKDEPFLFETIAHEIGHVLVGNGHPNDGTNQFTLPGTAHHKRLMRSGGLNRPDSGHLLVKHEWDAAEEWLQTEEQENRLGE
jgi:hypothetical protein